MERFWAMGNDLTRGRNLAWYLATTTSNKPAYGWSKRHHDDPKVAKALALALGEAVHEETEKAVAILMWAGANSHRKVQSLRWGSDVDDDPEDDYTSAVELAVELGHGKLLKYLKPHPALDNFDDLLGLVCDPDAVDPDQLCQRGGLEPRYQRLFAGGKRRLSCHRNRLDSRTNSGELAGRFMC